MRKIFSALVLVSLLGLIAPMVVSAQANATAEEIPKELKGCKMRHELTGDDWEARGFNCPSKNQSCTFGDEAHTCAACCLMDAIYTVTNWMFIAVLVIATLMIFVGAYNIVTAGGAAEKVTTGRNYILFATIGFLVALLAKVIPWVVSSVIGLIH